MDDLLWMGPALIAGVAATRFGLPPMVGYLLCGFVLNASGVIDHDRLTMIGDLGVTLLLFTIGLKLDLRSLLKPVVWAGTTLHMAIVVAVFGTTFYWMGLSGIEWFARKDRSVRFGSVRCQRWPPTFWLRCSEVCSIAAPS